MEVTHKQDVLLAAQKALNQIALDQDLRQVAYGKLVEWMADEASPAQGKTRGIIGSAASGSVAPDMSPIGTIASSLSLDVEVVEETFAQGDDRLEVALPAKKLSRAKTAATRELATVLVLGRQVGEGEDWIPVSAIRDLCADYGVLDIPNFAATMTGMDDIFQLRGRGQAREVHLRRAGIEVAKGLLLNFAGVAREEA